MADRAAGVKRAGVVSYVMLTLLGAMIGAGAGEEFGALVGIVVGYLGAHQRATSLRMRGLEFEQETLIGEMARLQQALLKRGDRDAAGESARQSHPESKTLRAPELPGAPPISDLASDLASDLDPDQASDLDPDQASDQVATPEPAQSPRAPQAQPATPAPAPQPTPVQGPGRMDVWLDAAGAYTRDLLFGGNTVVRVGILVLLVGVTLLLKYAADHDRLPIEIRMIGAAGLALALVVVGFRQRDTRAGFGLTLQGGGIAALYLVVFFAFRSYELLPPSLAFVLLVAIAGLSGLLAVLQNSMALIVIGQLGGFLAPVLASTGSGSHVALFSYYMVLNLVILVIAWFKSWRALNLVGFVCTFGIATAWGALKYQPEHLASTEPFLIGFFLLYVAIPVMFAVRSPGRRQGWVDGSLVFGTPLAALTLQAALVSDIKFAMAFSTVAMAAVYIGLGMWLQRKAPEGFRTMVESFVALGAGFLTIAVPYALGDQHLTGATWAVEGAGLYWLGVRQQRWFSRATGAALQLAAGVAVCSDFFAAIDHDPVPLANPRFAAGFCLGLGALILARSAHAGRARLHAGEWKTAQAFIVWGLCFWLGIALDELDDACGDATFPGFALVLVGGTAIALELAGRRWAWLPGRYPGALCAPLGLLLVLIWEAGLDTHPLGDGGWFGWPVYSVAIALVLQRFITDGPAMAKYLAPITLWLASSWLALELRRFAEVVLELDSAWGQAAIGIVLSVALIVSCKLAARARAIATPIVPVACHLVVAAGGLFVAAVIWLLAISLVADANPAPLPYIPVLNPLDLAQLFVLTAIAAWIWMLHGTSLSEPMTPGTRALVAGTALIGFLWFNAMLARSVYHYADVARMDWSLLVQTMPLQVAYSISWTLLGLTTTVWASRVRSRAIWFVGVCLLGITVGKLFLVDLSQLAPVAKISTFMVVGLLLLVVGYLAPVPPAKTNAPEH